MAKLKIKSIDDIKKVYDKIKKLDEEIIKIERAAMVLANKESSTKIRISLNVKDKTPAKPNCEDLFDEDGSLKYKFPSFREFLQNHRTVVGIDFGMYDVPAVSSKTDIIETELEDTMGLEILGIIIAGKNKKRQKLISTLKRLGFEL